MSAGPETGAAAAPEAPWHAAYPKPKTSEPASLSSEEVLALLKGRSENAASNDFVLVDVRRNDHQGGTVRGSINLPAQSLYPSIPTLYGLFKAAGVKQVIFYCGSSAGRGTRAAGWLADYLAERGDKDLQSVLLKGGIKGWVAAGPEFTEWMDEYDETAWS
ncbi:Rhodanese-like protein [Sodiomyces alkalinus F11]|uniref:Rhodanese-like protein n=1 Tax=Sodiomyces alkalinus (strain CBS 110278 / VKM F-3762 / F11) TaxID=1314773 RepID=A0A3N2Q5D2_SODAK|nr:Rhodanese-like protein [Sodiomyces alkalinus F11]ROT41984.1 Rhodanese-like protein [Sodiomyces alkalinus F11]